MTGHLLKKAVSLAAVLFLVSFTVFSVLFVLPGDPAQIILGINASPETLAALYRAKENGRNRCELELV